MTLQDIKKKPYNMPAFRSTYRIVENVCTPTQMLKRREDALETLGKFDSEKRYLI